MKKPYKIIYHVFDWMDDNSDGFFKTLREAKKYYKKLATEGYSERRLYKEVYATKELYDYDNPEELCLENDKLD